MVEVTKVTILRFYLSETIIKYPVVPKGFIPTAVAIRNKTMYYG
jgi:hypothetical protein